MAPPTFRDHLLRCLGGPWPEPGPLNTAAAGITKTDGYRIETVSYEAEPGNRIPALLLVPDAASPTAPVPAVAVWHQHAEQWHLGKSEPAGLAGDPMYHVGPALAREGYVVLCPDALTFEDRRHPDLEGDRYERFEFLRYVVAGKCLAWKNILDMRRTVDYLVSRPEVDTERIGCFGHSMGATHTWLVGPWEPRLKCLVANCCLPTYAAIQRKALIHCFPNFIPGLLQHGDTPDIAALIAPRPLLMNFGENDTGSPIEEVREATLLAAERRVRPCLMTSATTILALIPILTSTGRGSDIMLPMAIPSFGGMLVVMISIFVVPVLYCWIQEFNVRGPQDS
jgi:dienelactone hydrolase